MANYKVNTKSKTISILGPLTAMEKEIIATYIAAGYKVREKRASNVVRLKDSAVIKYLDEIINDKNKSEKEKEVAIEIKTNYENKKKEIMFDKNGKQRQKGFLGASQWLKEKHYDVYDAVMEKLESNEEITAKRRKKAEDAK